MGRTLSRVAGIVSAGALITFAAAPAALAEDETPTSTTETTTSTTSTTETTTAPSTTGTTTTVPSSTSGIATSSPTPPEVKTTEKRVASKAEAPEIKGDTQEAAADDDPQQDNVGHGFVGLGGEGVLVIACAAGAPGSVATQYLDVTSGPDQDGANGLLWNYTVRVANLPAGTTTGKFSWTCGEQEGEGIVEFEQEQPPTTSTTTSSSSASPSSSAPVTTATSAPTTTASGNAAPKAQVKVTPKGKIETGFGGTAW
ncbi:hypothetical protein [Amycolatopsis sp. NPDC098790]|uniref:hypothetical protein n=1 Tax=Amycolatopsis sp. NPDC098790 TaxID=3363939 RepID=UPI003829775B